MLLTYLMQYSLVFHFNAYVNRIGTIWNQYNCKVLIESRLISINAMITILSISGGSYFGDLVKHKSTTKKQKFASEIQIHGMCCSIDKQKHYSQSIQRQQLRTKKIIKKVVIRINITYIAIKSMHKRLSKTMTVLSFPWHSIKIISTDASNLQKWITSCKV